MLKREEEGSDVTATEEAFEENVLTKSMIKILFNIRII